MRHQSNKMKKINSSDLYFGRLFNSRKILRFKSNFFLSAEKTKLNLNHKNTNLLQKERLDETDMRFADLEDEFQQFKKEVDDEKRTQRGSKLK